MTSEQSAHDPREGGHDGRVPAGLRKCSFCAAIAYPGDDYCASCGNHLTPAELKPADQSCPACGTVIRNRIAFHCIRCGARLDRRGRKPDAGR